jgi:hypothetical protein
MLSSKKESRPDPDNHSRPIWHPILRSENRYGPSIILPNNQNWFVVAESHDPSSLTESSSKELTQQSNTAEDQFVVNLVLTLIPSSVPSQASQLCLSTSVLSVSFVLSYRPFLLECEAIHVPSTVYIQSPTEIVLHAALCDIRLLAWQPTSP